MRSGTGTGQGGKTLNDRRLAADVRNISLTLIKKYLTDETEENQEFRKQLLLKLSVNVLPRLNEHSGLDGEALTVQVISFDAHSHNSVQPPSADGLSEEIPSE